MKHPASNGKATKDMDASTSSQKGGGMSSPSTRDSGSTSKVSRQDDLSSPANSRKGSAK